VIWIGPIVKIVGESIVLVSWMGFYIFISRPTVVVHTTAQAWSVERVVTNGKVFIGLGSEFFMKRPGRLALGLAGLLAAAGVGCSDLKQEVQYPQWHDSPTASYSSEGIRYRELFRYLDKNGQEKSFEIGERRLPNAKDWHLFYIPSNPEELDILDDKLPNLAEFVRQNRKLVSRVVVEEVCSGSGVMGLRFVLDGYVINRYGSARESKRRDKNDGTIGAEDFYFGF